MSATITMSPNPTRRITLKGWHTDPFEQHELRFHDGESWTDHVTHFGPVPCRGCHPTQR